MQNLRGFKTSLIPGTKAAEQVPIPRSGWLIPLLTIVALVILLMAPASAWASSSASGVNARVQLQNDGTIQVTETIDFTDLDTSEKMVWVFTSLTKNVDLKVNSVTLSPLGALPEAPISGKDAGDQDVDFTCWATDFHMESSEDDPETTLPTGSLFLFFGDADKSVLQNQNVQLTIDLTFVNGIAVHKDVADATWRFVPNTIGLSSTDVNATFVLPLPEGATVEPGTNVRAWGHGPADGTVSINADGTVTCHSPKVEDGQLAECRIVFPQSWITQPSASTESLRENTNYLEGILASEEKWADSGSWSTANFLTVTAAGIIVGILVLIWALLVILGALRSSKNAMQIAAGCCLIAYVAAFFLFSNIPLLVVGLALTLILMVLAHFAPDRAK